MPMFSLCRRVKRKLSDPATCEATAAVLQNHDLLHQVLSKLAMGNGCSLAARQQLAQVCRLWRDVSKTLPVSLQLLKPLNDTQVSTFPVFPLCQYDTADDALLKML